MRHKLLSTSILFLALTTAVSGSVLERVHLANNGKALLEFSFVQDSSFQGIPSFFQKYDKENSIFSINFLETSSLIQMGSYPVPGINDYSSKISLNMSKGMKQNKITNFLKIEFKTGSGMNKAKYKAARKGKNTLILVLGPSQGKKVFWTITQSTQPSQKEQPLTDTKASTESTGDTKPTDTFTQDALAISKILGTQTALIIGLNIDTTSMKTQVRSSRTFSTSEGKKKIIILRDSINLRKGPSTSYKSITKLGIGTKVSMLSLKKNWYKVCTPEDTGYIRNDMGAYPDELTAKQVKHLKTKLKKKIGFKKMLESQEKARIEAEEKAKKEAEAAIARKKAKKEAEERARKSAEEKARKQAEEKASRLAEEKAKKEAEEAFIKEKARLKAEKLAKEEEAKRLAEITAKKLAAEEKARERAMKEAKKRALEEEKKRNAEEKRLKREQEIALKLAVQRKEEAQKKKEIEREKKQIRYTSFGRRDPFVPMKHDAYDSEEIRLDQMKLAGIIWNSSAPLAVLEHKVESGISITLQEDDIISKARVSKITRNKIVFEISEYGVLRFYTLRLDSDKKGL